MQCAGRHSLCLTQLKKRWVLPQNVGVNSWPFSFPVPRSWLVCGTSGCVSIRVWGACGVGGVLCPQEAPSVPAPGRGEGRNVLFCACQWRGWVCCWGLPLGLSPAASGPGPLTRDTPKAAPGHGSWHGAGMCQHRGVSTGSSWDGHPQCWHPWLTCGYLASEVSQPSPFALLSCTPLLPLWGHREPLWCVLGSTAWGEGCGQPCERREPLSAAQLSSAQLGTVQHSSAQRGSHSSEGGEL